MQLCRERAYSNKKAVLKPAFYTRGQNGITVPPRSPRALRSDRNAHKCGGTGEVHRSLRRRLIDAVAESHARAVGFGDPWSVCVLVMVSLVSSNFLVFSSNNCHFRRAVGNYKVGMKILSSRFCCLCSVLMSLRFLHNLYAIAHLLDYAK